MRAVDFTPKQPWYPHAMRTAPALDHNAPARPIADRLAWLINPFYPKDPRASFGKHVLTPSLALTSFAATTPSDWTVRLFDENLLQGLPCQGTLPQLVGITVHLTFAKRAYELARWFRARGVKVVFGGLHVLSCPDEVRPHCDAIALGDGTQLWPRILRDAAMNRLQPTYEADYSNRYEDDPPPARHLIPQKSFLTTTSLIATRGCSNRCGFCYLSTKGLRVPYRAKRPEQIANEFAQNGEPYGVFIDNNLGMDHEYLYRLCQCLEPLHKIWSAAVTLDVSDDPQLIRAMARSGCTGVFIGFESLTDENLSEAGKKTPKVKEYINRVRIFHDHGIAVNGSFVVGFDHDRKDDFVTLVSWIEQAKLECATFHILTPYPGTPLFRQMDSEGRLLHKNWELYDTGHAVFQPKQMSPQELENGYAWLYHKLFGPQSIWNRKPHCIGDWPSYFAGAILYKKSNWLWYFLIKHQFVHRVWSPMVQLALRKHAIAKRRMNPDSETILLPQTLTSG